MAKRKESGKKEEQGKTKKPVNKVEAASKKGRTAQKTVDISGWKPKTELGKKVKNREITNIDEILDNSLRILELEIVDALLNLEQDLLLIGQSKGKFGGGSRRVFRQTQKKTREGNKPKFSTIAVVGDKNGHVGIGFGKSKETVPAREKAIRKAKLNIFKIRRGCGSWECGCGEPHSIPFTVTGKCGSVEIKLIPAPKGKGLCCEKEIAKILELAGVKDVWTKTRGQTKNKVNFVYSCEDALRKLVKTKVQPEHFNTLAIAEGSLAEEQAQEEKEEGKEGKEGTEETKGTAQK
nr:30S ribosomal protein S5 [Nanoarchaeota archaeon]